MQKRPVLSTSSSFVCLDLNFWRAAAVIQEFVWVILVGLLTAPPLNQPPSLSEGGHKEWVFPILIWSLIQFYLPAPLASALFALELYILILNPFSFRELTTMTPATTELANLEHNCGRRNTIIIIKHTTAHKAEETTVQGTRPFGQPLRLVAATDGAVVDGKPPPKRGTMRKKK